MLKARELLNIIEIGQTAMGCDEVDELRATVVKLVLDTFDVERANFFLVRSYPSPRIDLDHIIAEGIEQQYLNLYRQRYNQMDPLLKSLLASSQVVTTKDVISARDLDRSEYYNDFLKPQSIHHQMVIYLRSGGQTLGLLGLCRGKREKDFSSTDSAKGELLGSYLAGALERAIFMGKVTKSSEIIHSICPDLPYKGLMVLDERLDLVYASEGALETISCLEGDEPVTGESKPPLPEELYAMSQNLLESSAAESGRTSSVEIDLKARGTGHPVSSSLRVVDCPQNKRLCLIHFGQDESADLLRAQLEKCGLSRRELDVAGLVCEGLKNSEISEKLFISEYTVENHLRSIYEKLEVKNRTAMAHKVMSLTGRR
jgi:DNA-binding CsgD family transcriptional regulator